MNINEVPANSVQHDYRWDNAPTSYSGSIASVLDLTYNADWRTQLFVYPNAKTHIFVRSRHSGTTWGNWRELAFTDSNVASATKLGTATVGGSAHPIYLNAGTPTACGYSFGNATGNAPLNNGTLNVSLNADMLDGVHGKGYMYRNGYHCTDGCLVRLKLLESGNDMVTVHIHGNSYHHGFMPIDTWVQFYQYKLGDAITSEGAINNGYDFGNINVFCYDGHVYLWFKQAGSYQSFSVYAECTNNYHIGNLVENITNAAMPTEGVTRLKTIVPKKSALTTDLSNVLKEDVVDGPVLEEIENLTKEELKAELLGDVDSKLDAALTAKQDKLVNSADITVGEDDKLSVTDAAVKKAFIKRWENLGTLYSDSLRGSYNKETDLFTITWFTRNPEPRKYQPYFTYKQAMAALDAVTGPVLGNDSFAPSIPANLPPIGHPMSPGPKLTVVDADCVVYNYEIKTLMLSTVGPCTVTQTMVLTSASELQAIIGDVIIRSDIYENPISFSSAGSGFPKLEYFHITIKKSFDVQTSPLLTFSTMQYLVANAANTSPITVTVHPDVYAKLTGDTTNAAASALTAGDLAQWQALVRTANSKNISFATTSN